MPITIGNASDSGNPGTVDTAYDWLHTCAADTNLLVVCVSTRETTAADRVVSGITYDGGVVPPGNFEKVPGLTPFGPLVAERPVEKIAIID